MDGLLNTELLKKLILEYQQAKQAEENRIYSADELAELNRVIAKTGAYSGLSDNVKAQLENTYTPEQKALRAWSNAKQAADRENSAFGSGIASLFTGGLSDVVQGKAPGSGLGNLSPVMNFMNPGLVSGYGVVDNLKEGNWAKALNYAVDPVTEPGIDWLATSSGKQLEKLVPGVTQLGPTLGALIGTAIAPGYGTLAGYELGNKIKGGSALEGVIGGGAIGATYGLSSLLSPYLSSVLGDKAGAVASKALGRIGGKAVNIGGKYLANALNPRSAATAVSPLLAQTLSSNNQDQSGYQPQQASGGLLSPKTNLLSTPETQNYFIAPSNPNQSESMPINWASEVEKLRMPLEIKKKKEEEDSYMNYKFKPKDYLVNYL